MEEDKETTEDGFITPILEEIQNPNNLGIGEFFITTPKPIGRPSTYTKELADIICSRLAEGQSMRKVCLDEEMPAMSSVFKWLRENKEFSEQYAQAKEESADADAEMLEDIGDKAIEEAKTVDVKASNAVVSAYKLKADNIKWSMSKKRPKKYGDKMDVTTDGKAIQGNTIVFSDFKNATESQPGI